MTPHETGATATPGAPRAAPPPHTFGPQGPTLGDLSDAYLQDYQVRRHCQVDVERTGSAADGAMMQPSDSDTRHLPPDPKGSRAQQAMVDGSQEVTTDTKQI